MPIRTAIPARSRAGRSSNAPADYGQRRRAGGARQPLADIDLRQQRQRKRADQKRVDLCRAEA